MNKIFILVLVCFSLVSCSSNKNEVYENIVTQLKSNYNKGDYEGIFNMYSEDMQGFSDMEKTIAFYKDNVKASTGNWNTSEFKTTLNDKYIYKLSFDKSEALLSLKLDDNNKISYLLLKK